MENVYFASVLEVAAANSHGCTDNQHAAGAAPAAVGRHVHGKAEFVAGGGIRGGEGLNVPPCVWSGVALLNQSLVPVVLKDVHFSRGAGCSRSAHCGESASAINGHGGAKQVTDSWRSGRYEHLLDGAVESSVRTLGGMWRCLGSGGDRRVTFCVLREKSLVAAKTEHGVNIMRRRRIEGRLRGGVKRGRRSGRARRGGVMRRRRPLNVIRL
jgi:hypothetical protein